MFISGNLSNIRITREEENALIIRSQKACKCNGNSNIHCDPCDARSELIGVHSRFLLKLCIQCCKNWELENTQPQELMADAIEGFCKAIKSIKANSKARLLTYAEKAIISSLADSNLRTGVIEIPAWIRKLRRRIKRLKISALDSGVELTIEEIAIAVKESVTTVKRALSTVECELGLPTVELDYEDNPQIYKSLAVEDEDEWMKKMDAHIYLSMLSKSQQEIICAKFGIDQPKLTDKEISKKFGIPVGSLASVYNRALTTMQKQAIGEECP